MKKMKSESTNSLGHEERLPERHEEPVIRYLRKEALAFSLITVLQTEQQESA